MSRRPARLLAAICACGMLAASAAGATQDSRGKASAEAKDSDNGVARFCANAAPAAQEARIAWQMKRLDELDGRLKQRIAELEKSEAAAREWVDKRDALLKSASEDVAAIYSKMQPEAAAAQMNAMEESLAAAILSKLKPKTASAILNEMEAPRAGRLTAIIAGAATEKKS
jgi:flagellar motility protein MotE (MotC chaperone)